MVPRIRSKAGEDRMTAEIEDLLISILRDIEKAMREPKGNGELPKDFDFYADEQEDAA